MFPTVRLVGELAKVNDEIEGLAAQLEQLSEQLLSGAASADAEMIAAAEQALAQIDARLSEEILPLVAKLGSAS